VSSCELLDITTNHAFGEEAVFTNGRAKGKAKREDGPSSGQGKRKKKDRRHAD
jgi:hypothetical protein